MTYGLAWLQHEGLSDEEIEETQMWYFNILGEPVVTLPNGFEALSYAIWNELIAASEAYFWHRQTEWAGSNRAPEFTQEQVDKQFAYWNGYSKDSGAMNWRGNNLREFVFDFEALPAGMKRAVCERVWALCADATLEKSSEWQNVSSARRTM